MVKLAGFTGFCLYKFFFFFFFALTNTSSLIVSIIVFGINEINICPEKHLFSITLVVMFLLPYYFLIECEAIKLVCFRIYICDISNKN